MGPATKPCSVRAAISSVMLGARPQSSEAMTNSVTLATNSRTWPKRCDSQPVSGTAIALATAKLVMTQVPCVGLTPRSPAMAGRDTLAIDVSSTFMKVAADRASVPQVRTLPLRGGGSRGGVCAGAVMRGRSEVRLDDARHVGLGALVQRLVHGRLGHRLLARCLGQRGAVAVLGVHRHL